MQKEKGDGQLQTGGVGGGEFLQSAEDWRDDLAVFEDSDRSEHEAGPCVNEGLEENELAGYAAEIGGEQGNGQADADAATIHHQGRFR